LDLSFWVSFATGVVVATIIVVATVVVIATAGGSLCCYTFANQQSRDGRS